MEIFDYIHSTLSGMWFCHAFYTVAVLRKKERNIFIAEKLPEVAVENKV